MGIVNNSTVTLQNLVDDAASNGDVSPALATGGWSDSIAKSIGNDVMAAMLRGGPNSEPLNWKFNRFNTPSFVTISWQQDYFVPGVVNIGWMESAWASNINSTANPKQKLYLEVHRDLEVTWVQTGYPGKICWIPNGLAITGTWGAPPLGPTTGNLQGQTNAIGANPSGLQNPGPNVIYTNPIGQISNPVNATTCITDPNGNLWALTTYGTCGAVQPTWPTNPTFPTYQNPNTTATTQTDGTCVWTAINPAGQAFRLSPIPPQTGVVWLVQPICQMRQPIFTSLGQTLNPIPDDYSVYFKQGFFAQCYRRNPDPKVRARFPEEWALFLKTLDDAVKSGQREMDDDGFYPTTNIMDSGTSVYSITIPNAAYPWPM